MLCKLSPAQIYNLGNKGELYLLLFVYFWYAIHSSKSSKLKKCWKMKTVTRVRRRVVSVSFKAKQTCIDSFLFDVFAWLCNPRRHFLQVYTSKSVGNFYSRVEEHRFTSSLRNHHPKVHTKENCSTFQELRIQDLLPHPSYSFIPSYSLT